MGVQIWNEKYQQIEIFPMTGSRRLNGTIDNAAAVNNGGYAQIPITNHGLTAGSTIRISGSVAYNGFHLITEVVTANAIKLATAYVAEAFAGTEAYVIEVKPVAAFQLVETRLVLSGASAAENFLVKLDANAGATYDCTLQTVAMNGLTQDIKVWMAADQRRFFDKGDAILFEYANTNNLTWTLSAIYRRLA
jgi:hypothetical protein